MTDVLEPCASPTLGNRQHKDARERKLSSFDVYIRGIKKVSSRQFNGETVHSREFYSLITVAVTQLNDQPGPITFTSPGLALQCICIRIMNQLTNTEPGQHKETVLVAAHCKGFVPLTETKFWGREVVLDQPNDEAEDE